LPVGQFVTATVQTLAQKDFTFAVGQITFRSSPVPRLYRGAFRDRHGRWAAGCDGRFYAVKTSGTEADGKIVWS
jgi:hypothetical protein